MNIIAFNKAGLHIPEGVPLSWGTILNGINCVLKQSSDTSKTKFPNLHLNGSSTLGSNTTPVTRLKNFESAGSQNSHNERNKLIAERQIVNKIPAATNLVFPFFPISQRRHMSRVQALKEMGKFITESFYAKPVQASGVVLGMVGGTYTLGYTVYKDKQEYNQRERQHQENLDRKDRELQIKERELDTNFQVESQKLDLESQKLHLESRRLDLIEQGKIPQSELLKSTIIVDKGAERASFAPSPSTVSAAVGDAASNSIIKKMNFSRGSMMAEEQKILVSEPIMKIAKQFLSDFI